MRQFQLSVGEIATSGVFGQVHVRCAGEQPSASGAPGQFYLALADVSPRPFLRASLFPYPGPRGELTFSLHPAHPFASLQPGAWLDLVGPCGRGFALHPRAWNFLLVAESIERLLPLAHFALASRRSVTLLLPSGAPLPDLPPAVEIQRGPLTADLAAWADLIALDAPDPERRAREARVLCPTRPADFVQALVVPPMPCGTGACRACWVELGERRQLACVDGPVFSL